MTKLGFTLALTLGATLAAAQPKPAVSIAAAVTPGTPADLAPLAEKIVGTTLDVKEGEIVQINTTAADTQFAEELALAIRKRGAYPLITLQMSEPSMKKALAEVPAKYDAQPPVVGLGITKMINARIIIAGATNPAVFQALPVDRRAAQAKSDQQVFEATIKKSVRLVELGNGFTPAPWRAAELGIGMPELTRMYWDGLNADAASLATKAAAVKAVLAAGGEVHVTHPNGLDLKFKIKGRKVGTSSGVISAEARKAGGSNVMTWLPAGEVYLSPVPGSVEGKIVDDRVVIDGKEVLGLTAEIKASKVTTISAKSGWDGVKPLYDAGGPLATELSAFDIGINPAIKATSKFQSFVAAGTVTLNLGNSLWANGTNNSSFNVPLFINGATVTVDGKPLVEAGALK